MFPLNTASFRGHSYRESQDCNPSRVEYVNTNTWFYFYHRIELNNFKLSSTVKHKQFLTLKSLIHPYESDLGDERNDQNQEAISDTEMFVLQP